MTETVNLAEAKATLSELVRRAAAGETINIALRGKPVVQIGPLGAKGKDDGYRFASQADRRHDITPS